MSLLLSMAVRNLGRNRRRTLLTALTVTLGVALLTNALAFVGGVFWGILEQVANQAGHVRVVTEKYAQREQLMPIAENLGASDALVTTIAAAPGVTAVFPHIAMGVTGAVGDDEIGERFALLHGAPTLYYTDFLDLDGHLMSGVMPAAGNDALIGRAFADEIHATVGSEVILLGQTQDGSPSPIKVNVSGIVDLGNAQQNRQVWVSLERARWMADIPEGAVELLVFGADFQRADTLAASLQTLPALATLSVSSWDGRAPYNGFLGFAQAMHTIAAAIIVFITALGVLNTMFMSVLERTAEVGVMRAMGLRAWQTVSLFFFEALAIGALGGLLGVALGTPVAMFLEHRGVNFGEATSKLPATIPVNEIVRPDVTIDIVIGGFLLGLAMAVVGGFLPAVRASRIQPVEAMRSRR